MAQRTPSLTYSGSVSTQLSFGGEDKSRLKKCVNIIFPILASIDFYDFYSLAQVKKTEISDIFALDLRRLILSILLPAGSEITGAAYGKANGVIIA